MELINYNGWILNWRMSSYLSIPYKQWASAPLFLRKGELLGHSPILNSCMLVYLVITIHNLNVDFP